jgi:TolB-like protein
VADVLHATKYEQPPALVGSAAITAVDRVIRRAMTKRPADRPASAAEMAADLGGVRATDTGTMPILAHALTRLVVLPFRVLRPDPETDFLAFSLPDAIATSLAGNPSIVVRSSAVASRFAGGVTDLKALATEADVDRVVLGTLLRARDRLRASAQLVEVPAGTLLTSQTVEASTGDLFGLQDDIARRVADALSLPLGGAAAPRQTPDGRAYELYLRGNELARTYQGLQAARELYIRCVELDPGFAPAWAQLGRCHRLIGKYVESAPDSELRAAEAFRRALALNPRLSIAHKFFANLEADTGECERAIRRLSGEAQRHGNDPELFAGLVHACRYGGLFDEAIAAHDEARRLDPNVPTSLEQTLLMAGDVERLLAVERPRIVAGADDGIHVIGLGLSGRREEARRLLQEMRKTSRIPLFARWIEYLGAWLDRRPAEMDARMRELGMLNVPHDPEARFQIGWLLCDVGELDAGLRHIQQAVTRGYFVAPSLARWPQFDALRGDAAFVAILDEAEAGRRRSLAAFRDCGGARMLGF